MKIMTQCYKKIKMNYRRDTTVSMFNYHECGFYRFGIFSFRNTINIRI